jgi:N-carbamoylputrescine amidase
MRQRDKLNVGLVQQANMAFAEDNIRRLESAITQCAHEGAELVVLQELHNSLYFCQSEDTRNFDHAEAVPGPSTSRFGALAAQLGVGLVLSLFERRAPGIYHNTAVVLDRDGSLAGRYRKMHIPDDPGFYEKFYFTPGDLGFEPVATSFGKLGILVCWDQWYPEAARLMALRGAELLIYPTAIGWDPTENRDEQQRQLDAWLTIQRAHAVANGLPLVSVNRVGAESAPVQPGTGIQFWGNSFVAGPQGEFLHRAPEDREHIAVVEVDLNRSEQVRRIWPFFRDRRVDAYQGLDQRFLE